jgi:hypothetical protein
VLSHALTIVANELNEHLKIYGPYSPDPPVCLGNIAEGVGSAAGHVPRGMLTLSIVNIKEDKALKNLPNVVRDNANLRLTYENPPVFLNFQILITATHAKYTEALMVLSRAIRFFQYKNIFTQENVAPASLTPPQYFNPLDQLEEFKLIFDLYSPTMEELNHLWGTLGGKQYPSVMYIMRLLDLKFKAVQSEGKLITEVVRDFHLKDPAAN